VVSEDEKAGEAGGESELEKRLSGEPQKVVKSVSVRCWCK
jgi:hypothetical protein